MQIDEIIKQDLAYYGGSLSPEAIKKITALISDQVAKADKNARIDELELHRGVAIGGGKAGIVLSYKEVDERIEQISTNKGKRIACYFGGYHKSGEICSHPKRSKE